MGLIIDGIGTSEAIDSSGELLQLKGLDISDLVEGKAVLNTEHRDSSSPGFSFLDIIGRVIYAKKIYSKDDCENDRQRMYWDKCKVPFLYIQNELFDSDEDGNHPAAKAAAAMIRHYARNKLPILIRYSVEGSTLEMKDKVITAAIARRVAATIRPCNKQCDSGILTDNNPKKKEGSYIEGEGGFLGEGSVSKFESPDAVRLGCSVELECNPGVDLVEIFAQKALRVIQLAKAIEGGSYNAPPSTLTQGAALQKEDLGKRKLIAICKGALRDYNKTVHGPFKPYLKNLLPEASEEFLDQFAELADNLDLKGKLSYLQKAQKDTEIEKKYKETLVKIKESKKQLPAAETPEFKKVRPRKLGRGESIVDEKTGVLHVGGTPPRAHKLYAPSSSDSHYMEHLTDPKINSVHDHAMKNWVLMHRLARSGKLPSEVIAHAGLFSLMSPNTAVPIQELAFGHLMDMQARGFDPTKKYSAKQFKQYEKEFKGLASGKTIPKYMHDYFLSEQAGIWRNPTKLEIEIGANPAEKIRYKIGMPEAKWSGVQHYHELHSFLEDLIKEHNTNAQIISAKLNELKHTKNLYAKQVENAKKAGKPVPPDPFEGHPDVTGFAPKTIRYTLGMLGAGNVIVPDTHFLRHTFGLHIQDPRVDDVKSALLKPNQEPLLQSIDRWYRANHPAYKWTRRKLKNQYGEDFGEQATFPSFWLHWLTIAPHEQETWGAGKTAQNEGTNHEVFWNSVHSILEKYGLPHDPHDISLRKSDTWEKASLAVRTAHAQKEIENRFGTTAATFAYYSYLAPLLLAPSKPVELYKAELLSRLAKGEYSAEAKPKLVLHQGSVVEPGEIDIAGKKKPLIAVNPDFFHVQREDGGLSKVPTSTVHSVLRLPKIVRANTVVDSTKHGHPTLHGTDLQHDIIHGVDLAKKILTGEKGSTAKRYEDTGWYKSKEGHLVYVKPNVPSAIYAGFECSHREAAFYRLASFFGLDRHVPVTTVFRHPVTEQWYSAQKQVNGDHVSTWGDQHNQFKLGQSARLGVSGKLALMDMILDQQDRHSGNCLVSKDNDIHLIDNGLSLGSDKILPFLPQYWQEGCQYNDGELWYTKPLPDSVVNWVGALDPQKLAEQMDRLGIPTKSRNESVRRLQKLKERVSKGNVSRGAAYLSPFLEGSESESSIKSIFKDISLA